MPKLETLLQFLLASPWSTSQQVNILGTVIWLDQ
ncbi:unnamed protein product [Paramecium primaurelia]|uniref:Uncharacterized protein n=1 Tax=Paramecium primaurelia TaxID=5886 RepID=A0A8S1QR26_PARPR|nr:unnamed protein product [Paramecium primaurelia]